jgi:N-methylhydantoinase A
MLRIATDIGGTFTDLVYADDETGELGHAKSPSTPDDFSEGVIAAVEKAGLVGRDAGQFLHGTTVVINALLQRTGGQVGVLVTEGFCDMFEIDRSNRPDIFSLCYAKPKPFVPRRHVVGVRERISADGSVLAELDAQGVRKAVALLEKESIQTVAICFLHSYKNPAHEVQCRDLIRSLAPHIHVTCSHELTKEWREFERASTAALNAYVLPVVAQYLGSLEGRLSKIGMTGRRLVMQSNGGVMTFGRAREVPVSMVESGPVAGVIGTVSLGKALGLGNIISLDVGGTTVKTSLIENGQMRVTTDYRVDASPFSPGYPIKMPTVDIVELGAGGGSIASISQTGAVRVGPKSAGASPGPACYRMGGQEPTVTDAHLLLNRISADYFLGGHIRLYREDAQAAIERVFKGLSVSVEEAARGILRLANANMMNALKLVSLRRGYDPRDFTLVVYGGGGPLHAGALGRELQVRQVIVPPMPAVFSAWGMLMADMRYDMLQTSVTRVNADAVWAIEARMREMGQDVSSVVREEAKEGPIVVGRSLDMRYVGQEHTVSVSIPEGRITPEILEALVSDFHSRHRQYYAFDLPGSPVEIVNFHVVGVATQPQPTIRRMAGSGSVDDALRECRRIDFDEDGIHEARVFERDLLPVRCHIEGPAIVEEPESATVISPKQSFSMDEIGNLVLDVGGG